MYLFGMAVHAIMFGVLLVLHVLLQCGWKAYRWVHDKDSDGHWLETFGIGKYADQLDFWMYTILGVLITLGAILLWPLIYPAAVIAGSLYAIRAFIRFKRKVTNALDKK